jgi:ketopantoate reductase
MKILILGAGVIGTTYAWQLSNAGQDVTLFVRKANLERIKKEGSPFDVRMSVRRKLLQWRLLIIRPS